MTQLNPQDCPSLPHNSPSIEALFPSNSQPERVLGCLSALCHYGLTPLAMQGALKQILCTHFSDANNLLNHQLRSSFAKRGPWILENADGSGPFSSIWIDSAGSWQPSKTEQRPAILIKEGDWEYQRIAINDSAETEVRNGTQYFNGLWVGSHTLFAVATENGEALQLGAEIAKLLIYQRLDIKQVLGLHDFRVLKLGAARRFRESNTVYFVPVDIVYALSEVWSVQQEAPRIKRITLSTSQVLQYY